MQCHGPKKIRGIWSSNTKSLGCLIVIIRCTWTAIAIEFGSMCTETCYTALSALYCLASVPKSKNTAVSSPRLTSTRVMVGCLETLTTKHFLSSLSGPKRMIAWALLGCFQALWSLRKIPNFMSAIGWLSRVCKSDKSKFINHSPCLHPYREEFWKFISRKGADITLLLGKQIVTAP